MLLKGANLFLGRSFVHTDIAFGETITAIGSLAGSSDSPVEGCYVIPGLVDIHTHGAVGRDFSDGNPGDLQILSNYYASRGVTSYLATTMTRREPALIAAMTALRDFASQGGAKCAGIHVEGPFLSTAKRGAHLAEELQHPDIGFFDRLNTASGGKIRLVTVACEEPGGMEFIAHASKVCTVSLGHTTAGYDTAISAYTSGASHATHLYNGMNSFLHREPGVIGAAMDMGAGVELICDGLHIHPAVVRATHRMFGNKLILISDSIRCAGLKDGCYVLGDGQSFTVTQGKALLTGTNTLAGSAISLLDGLRNAVRFGLSLEDAVYAATTAPAEAVKLDAGRIRVGAAADLVVLNPDLSLRAVFIDGKIWEAPSSIPFS